MRLILQPRNRKRRFRGLVGKKSAIGEVVKPGDYRALREGQNSLLVGKAHGGALGVEKVEKGPGAA